MSAVSEADASAVLAADRPSLVLLDADAPAGASWRVLRTLLRSSHAPPVVLLAEAGDISSRVRAMEAGCADVLTKPAAGPELLPRLEGVLRGWQLREFFDSATRGNAGSLQCQGVSVQDVIAGISKTSGRVSVEMDAGEHHGLLQFDVGRIIAAEYAGCVSDDALLLAYILPPDTYRLAPETGQRPSNLSGSTEEVLAALDVRVGSWQGVSDRLPSLTGYVVLDSNPPAALAAAWPALPALLRGHRTLFSVLAAQGPDLLRVAAELGSLAQQGLLKGDLRAPIAAEERAFAIAAPRGASLAPRAAPRPVSLAPAGRTNTLAPPSSVSGSAWLSPSVGPGRNLEDPHSVAPPASSSAVLILEEDLSSVHDLSAYDAPAPSAPTAQVETLREHQSPSDSVPPSRVPTSRPEEFASSSMLESDNVVEPGATSVPPSEPWSDPSLNPFSTPPRASEPAWSHAPGRKSGRVVATVFVSLLLVLSGVLVYGRLHVRGPGEVDPALLDGGLGEPASLAVSGTFAAGEPAAPLPAVEAADAGAPDAPDARPDSAPLAASPAAVASPPDAAPLLSRKQLETAFDRSQYKRVIEQGERVVAANPEDGEVWALLGAAYQVVAQAAKSKEAFAQCAKYAKGQTRAECQRYAR